MVNIGNALLPSPTTLGWAMYSPHPSSAVLLELGMTAAEVAPVVELEEAELAMRQAVVALAQSRPGGDQWSAAEHADVVAVRAGKPTGALAKLIAGDVQRWGEAVARTNLVAELSHAFSTVTGAEVKRAAGHVATARSMSITREIEEIVVPAWPKRADKAAAWTARNAADALCEQLAVASAVAAWSAGHAYDNGHKRVSPLGRAGGFLEALKLSLDGKRPMILNTKMQYPDDLDEEPREVRNGQMLLEGRLLPAASGRR